MAGRDRRREGDRIGVPYAFPPMNSRERRLLHLAFKSMRAWRRPAPAKGRTVFSRSFPQGKTDLPVAAACAGHGDLGRRVAQIDSSIRSQSCGYCHNTRNENSPYLLFCSRSRFHSPSRKSVWCSSIRMAQAPAAQTRWQCWRCCRRRRLRCWASRWSPATPGAMKRRCIPCACWS